MPGEIFLPGQTKIRPGVYVRTTNTGSPPAASVPQGIVAVLFTASWGPLATVQTLEGGVEEVESLYISGGTIETPKEVFRGNALRVLAFRLGTGGAKATVTLNDGATTPVNIVKVDAKYVGTVGNQIKITVRDSLSETGKREILVYQDTTLRERFTYTAGAYEAQALVDAVANSNWITASKLAVGDGSLATVTNQALTGGSDPTVSGTEYSAGLTAVEALEFNVLVTDSESAAIHATVQTYVDRVRNEGKRTLGVVGEPTSVALATRITNSKAFNDAAIVYAGNGFKSANGNIEGYKAAARVAGMVASGAITDSLTHTVVSGGTDIVGALTNAEVEQAINSGMLVFTFNASKQVQIEYGINTLVTPAADQDAGWKKIRRVRTRDFLIDSIVRTWDPLIGKVNNTPDGRATLIAAGQGIINEMISIGALLGGTIIEDPAKPAAGDSAWFVVNVDDVDSAEKLYITFGFRFSPAA
ncbi:phage tail sheath subtilisin-like domain-containing protein [Paenibacillus alkalitolerans]|uniref:phage tail sheath subtilisin-like domain-containing protein n=1 Tax=Paenibacillus alkalitolerans TaxID=2799335 RepID=UPI0018F3D4EA|nr:phage tail sheath subtilisin-like domain-containing protein [Paenibacillus alkalitolerans]